MTKPDQAIPSQPVTATQIRPIRPIPYLLTPRARLLLNMIVCSCNVLSDHKIRDVVTSAGSQSLTARQVYGCLGCRMQCGRCARAIKRILNEALADCAGGCASCAANRPSHRPVNAVA